MGIRILHPILDHDQRGIVVKDLELGKLLPNAVLDIVVQTINQKKMRGPHYHPESGGKVEIFVPLQGEAHLEWHDAEQAKNDGMAIMRPVTQDSKVYYIEPDTCHRVVATGASFLMLSPNNTTFKPSDTEKCVHSWIDRNTS